jgi:hypothetical protein
LVGWILSLFSSINRLICSIKHNNNQISYILKIFYDDMYFYVFIKIYDIIYIYIYICYFNSENDICILKLLVVFKNMCLSLKLQCQLWKFYLKIIIDVSILKIAIGILYYYYY